MDRVKKNLHLISNFQKLNRCQRKQIQKHLDPEQTKFFCELAINLLNSNLKADKKIISSLYPHRCKLRKLADPKRSLKDKKKILVGGFLPTLIASIASSVVSVGLEKLVEKYGKGKT